MRSGRTGAWRSTLAPISSRATTRGAELSWERRRASLAPFFTSTPMPRCSYTAQEFYFSAQNALRLPQSRLKSILGRPITNSSNCPTSRVDAHGHSYKKP